MTNNTITPSPPAASPIAAKARDGAAAVASVSLRVGSGIREEV